MNTTNCPQGYFTDEILVLPGSTPPCEGIVGLWYGLVIPLLAGKFILWVFQVKATLERKRRRRKPAAQGPAPKYACVRVPVFALTQTLVLVGHLLMFILSTLQITNSKSGGTYLILGLFFFC